MLYIYNVCFILQLSTAHGDFESRSWRGVHVPNTTLCDKVCQWFPPPIKLTATI